MKSDRSEPFRQFRLSDQRKKQVTIIGDVKRSTDANLPWAISHAGSPWTTRGRDLSRSRMNRTIIEGAEFCASKRFACNFLRLALSY
jgi:hypothetical protein